MIQITYRKKNGDIIQKIVNVYTQNRVGDINGYGWKVMDIKYLYKNNFVSISEYDKLLERDWNKDFKKMNIIKKIKRIYHDLGYCVGLIVAFRFLELSFKYVI